MTAPLGPAGLSALPALLRPRLDEESGGVPGALALSAASFRATVLEAMLQAAGPGSGVANGESAAAPPAPAAPVAADTRAVGHEAERTGVDPALLAALRRTENGGRGREFGVLSTPASGLEAQARVAAVSIRNSLARYAAQGGAAVDPATGRYTEDFLRFFSARYAPVGAANDPAGLNRFHAKNLIALYAAEARRGTDSVVPGSS